MTEKVLEQALDRAIEIIRLYADQIAGCDLDLFYEYDPRTGKEYPPGTMAREFLGALEKEKA